MAAGSEALEEEPRAALLLLLQLLPLSGCFM